MFVLNTKFFSLTQDSHSRTFHLDLEHKSVSLRFCELLALREKIFSLEIASLFYEDTCPHDFKIMTLCNQQHLLLLSIEEVIDLRKLVQQAFITMGLSKVNKPVYI